MKVAQAGIMSAEAFYRKNLRAPIEDDKHVIIDFSPEKLENMHVANFARVGVSHFPH